MFSDEEVNCRVTTSTVFLWLAIRQKGHLLTFNIIDRTPSAQISPSKLEQPWVENLQAAKVHSSWEDTKDA